jgi:hypothetical protein
MGKLAKELGVGKKGLELACEAYEKWWQGGNQWSAWDSCLSFFRYVAKLPIDYTAWDSWETLSLHSGPRCVHEKFCMISDRPEILTVDEQNRPHNATGPFCQWRDGTAIWAIHGVFIRSGAILHPEKITAQEIHSENNEEVKRVLIEQMGWVKYLRESKAKLLDSRYNERDMQTEELYSASDGRRRIVVADPSTGRRYALGVPREVATCEQAQNFLSHGLDKRAVCRT